MTGVAPAAGAEYEDLVAGGPAQDEWLASTRKS